MYADKEFKEHGIEMEDSYDGDKQIRVCTCEKVAKTMTIATKFIIGVVFTCLRVVSQFI